MAQWRTCAPYRLSVGPSIGVWWASASRILDTDLVFMGPLPLHDAGRGGLDVTGCSKCMFMRWESTCMELPKLQAGTVRVCRWGFASLALLAISQSKGIKKSAVFSRNA